jgi:hypothetical protein
MFPPTPINYIECSALLVSVFAYPRLSGSSLRWFPLFLLFIVLVEFAGKYIHVVLGGHNAWLFNISTTLEFVFYAFIFETAISETAYKRIIHWFIIFYPVLVLFNLAFIQGFNHFHTYTMAAGSAFMIFFSCLFFYALWMNPREEDLIRDPMFWVGTGILFCNLGGLIYGLILNFPYKYVYNTGSNLFQTIINILNLVLYSCFIIAFLCKRDRRKSLK